jgi:hypothetical protein
VIVGVAWAGKLSPIAQQFVAEVEIEASIVKRSRELIQPRERAWTDER